MPEQKRRWMSEVLKLAHHHPTVRERKEVLCARIDVR